MEAFINSFLLVFIGEMGDKTQLLALVLVTKFRRPWTILSGIFVATLLNHALATWAGAWISTLFSPTALKWTLGISFFLFAFWILIPDKEEESEQMRRGAFLTTVISFFIAEMGDKTQLATVALGAKFSTAVWITLIGTTIGMLASNALAIFLGDHLLSRIPMKWVRIFACFLFMGFGIAILVGFNSLY
ncbi:MAG: TMEM165/GDT1 family protein [Oligoflexia bacterium]|nr:TMEM165/GDT1 family protein [Oligoflexia bacterium]